MKVKSIKTDKVLVGKSDLFSFLDQFLPQIKENSIVVVTSKIISIFEGRTLPIGSIDKEKLIHKEADLYLDNDNTKKQYIRHFTIIKDTYIPASCIDESNSNGYYVLWPKDPQASANKIRLHLKKKYGLKHVGVLITDSTIFLSRWGTLGITIGFSGLVPYTDYRGTMDLFGKELKVSVSNVAGGLTAAAVTVMGEGKEQTPLAIIEDIPFVKFVDRDPTKEEINTYSLSPVKDEAFGNFFSSANWHKGGRSK